MLCSLAITIGSASVAQEVRLPLERFHELERRARETTPVQRPAAPFVLERAAVGVAVSDRRATIVERLELMVSHEGWQRLELPSPGRWVSVALGALEGRLDEEGSALHFRGAGKHSLELTAVAQVERQTRFGRTEWSVSFATPVAGVVVGSARAALGDAADADATLAVAGGGVALGPPDADGAVHFAALPAATVSITVRSEEPAATETVETVLDVDAITVARVRPTRLAARDQLVLHVVRGELSEVTIDLPAGSTVNTVSGPFVAGWRVEPEGSLRISFDPRTDTREPLRLEVARDLPMVSSRGEPPAGAGAPAADEPAIRAVTIAAATPRLPGARGERAVFALAAEADGIVTLLDPGSSRALSVAIAGDLREQIPADARRTARLLDGADALDSAGAPRWEVAWPDHTQVLAAAVDSLRVDWLWGVSGGAGLRISAQVRSTGLEVLELELPRSFELTAAAIDGAAVEIGRRGGLWAIPLRVDSGVQLVTLEGVAAVARPANGGVLELVVPAASAPISRVEVRGVLDGRYQYRLVDAERLEVEGRARRPLNGTRGFDWPVPPGHVTVEASWGALSTRPGPLRVEVRDEPEEATWY